MWFIMCNILFRYRSWERNRAYAEDIIKNHRLYLSFLYEQEDRNEADTFVTAGTTDYRDITISVDGQDTTVTQDWYDSDNAMRSLERAEREYRRQEVLICSFTMRHDNEYMWARYGYDETGICFEFHNLDSCINVGQLVTVQYCDATERCIRYDRYEELSKLHPQNITQNLFALKGREYAEEEEVRYIVQRNAIQMENDGHYYLQLPADTITNIYAGRCMSEDAYNELTQLVQRYLPHITVTRR